MFMNAFKITNNALSVIRGSLIIRFMLRYAQHSLFDRASPEPIENLRAGLSKGSLQTYVLLDEFNSTTLRSVRGVK